jgi:ubiquinone/menaquinone biosynthesis C-methylase UbiE
MYLHHCPDPLAAIKEMVRIIKPGGRLVITDLDTHTHSWMKKEMADEWLGFDRNQIRTWFQEMDLVNVLVDCTGESCCAKSEDENLAQTAEGQAEISVFVATGSKRIEMQPAVEKTYGALAENGLSCGCGSSSADDTGCGCGSSVQQTPGNYTQFYDPAEKDSVPQNAADFSLGCGNPIAMANLKPGETVLDIGSGGGLDSFLAARKVGPTGRVIGVDMTPAMIERARLAAQKAGIDTVEFREGRAEALPVEENTIDVILSNCVINLCEDKNVVFREAFRVLKNEGRLEISDIVSDNPMPAKARVVKEDWAACVTGALPENEYLDLVKQAGFQNVTVQRSTPYGSMEGVSVYSLRVSAFKSE